MNDSKDPLGPWGSFGPPSQEDALAWGEKTFPHPLMFPEALSLESPSSRAANGDVSFGLPFSQPEELLTLDAAVPGPVGLGTGHTVGQVVEVGMVPGDLVQVGDVLGGESAGGAGSTVTTTVKAAPGATAEDMSVEPLEPPELLEMGGQHRYGDLEFFFSMDKVGDGLTITQSPPGDIQIRPSSEEAQEIRSRNAATTFEDRGWFDGLKHSNKFRPTSPTRSSSDVSGCRPYISSHMAKPPRLRARAVNPFRGRVESRCKRCRGQLQGNRCRECGTEFCESCGETLTDSKCSNEFCPKYHVERCGNCGEETCACDR